MADATVSTSAPEASRTPRFAVLTLLIAASGVSAYLLRREVQPTVYDSKHANAALGVAALSLPFLLLPALMPMRTRATKVAWILCVIMAIDGFLIGFMKGGWSTGGGHPALEVMVSVLLGYAKLALVPASTVLLGWGWLKGERLALIATGFLCLVAASAVTLG